MRLFLPRSAARDARSDADLVVSPADGRIAAVGPAVPPRELDLGERPAARVSVFMNVFNCHVNRAPVAGRVTRIAYKPGKFVNAELDKASEDNERNCVVIETAHGPVGVVQIAGLVARRILCWSSEGEDLAAGQRFGMIRFGSRLDVYLPQRRGVTVNVGPDRDRRRNDDRLVRRATAGWPVRID